MCVVKPYLTAGTGADVESSCRVKTRACMQLIMSVLRIHMATLCTNRHRLSEVRCLVQ